MKARRSILYKWVILFCLLIIPYYIHSARVDRILNNYTQKSNALYLILPDQKSNLVDSNDCTNIAYLPIENICPLQLVLFHCNVKEIKSKILAKVFYLNTDIPPPHKA